MELFCWASTDGEYTSLCFISVEVNVRGVFISAGSYIPPAPKLGEPQSLQILSTYPGFYYADVCIMGRNMTYASSYVSTLCTKSSAAIIITAYDLHDDLFFYCVTALQLNWLGQATTPSLPVIMPPRCWQPQLLTTWAASMNAAATMVCFMYYHFSGAWRSLFVRWMHQSILYMLWNLYLLLPNCCQPLHPLESQHRLSIDIKQKSSKEGT